MDTGTYDLYTLSLHDALPICRDCWIGPYTVLDGNHALLEIGDCVDVGAGTQIYTHNTIERALTGRRAPLMGRATKIVLRSEEHTSELQSQFHLVCRLLLEKKK